MSKTIIIDAGHGGRDGGARGFGVNEKDWTLRISLYQYDRLKKLGADVQLTRTNDVTLDPVPRTNIIKRSGADICISNHWNAFSDGSANGVETIHSVYANSGLATRLCDAIVKTTGLGKRRVFDRVHPNGGDYYFMHRLTGSARTVIIEYGFITNRRDHDHYRNEANFIAAAEAVIEVLCREVGVKYRKPNETLQPDEKVDVEKVEVKVALQDLKLSTNQWKTQEVDVEGSFRLETNIHSYFGSPNFEDYAGLLERGSVVKFSKLAIPANSQHVWLTVTNLGKTRQLPIATVDEFNKGEYWGIFV